MVKIGEVEFLVKFDTVGKSFKTLITDAMEDISGTDLGNIEEEIRKIRAHLGVLKTGFSGDYRTDLIKKEAWIKQYADVGYMEDIALRIATSKTQLGYLDPEHKIEVGSEEALKKSTEFVENILARTLDLFERGFESTSAYANLGPKIRKVMKLFETTTETELGYLLKTVIGYLNVEAETDRRIVKEAMDKNAEAAITDTKAHFAQIAKEVGEGVDYVKTVEEFQKALTDYLSPENIDKLMLSSTVVLQGTLRTEIEEMLKKVKFTPSDFLVPRALLKTIEDITGITDLVGKVKAPDVRRVYRDLDELLSDVEEFHTEKTPAAIEKLKADLTATFEAMGWVFALWENKGVGSARSLQKDLELWEGWQAKFGAQVAGTGGAQVKSRFLSFAKGVDEIVESIASKDPERKEKALNDSLQQMLNIITATYDNTEDMPKDIKAVKEALEQNESSTFTEE